MTPYVTPMRGRRARLNESGRETAPRYADQEGVIHGEGRDKQSWKISFPGIKYPIGFHKSFVEILEPEVGIAGTDHRNTCRQMEK